MEIVKWFEDIGKTDVHKAGGKGANLGELVKAGLPVPPGYVITAQAYLLLPPPAGFPSGSLMPSRASMSMIRLPCRPRPRRYRI